MDRQRQARGLHLETVVAHDLTTVHLTVSGEIDVATADDLASAGGQALNRHGVSTLVINMAAVTFMSASGVGALVSINNNARQHGQVVVLVEPSRCVYRILELTGLTDVFRLCSSTKNRTD
jgi:anti-sigma B factor antagonist